MGELKLQKSLCCKSRRALISYASMFRSWGFSSNGITVSCGQAHVKDSPQVINPSKLVLLSLLIEMLVIGSLSFIGADDWA